MQLSTTSFKYVLPLHLCYYCYVLWLESTIDSVMSTCPVLSFPAQFFYGVNPSHIWSFSVPADFYFSSVMSFPRNLTFHDVPTVGQLHFHHFCHQQSFGLKYTDRHLLIISTYFHLQTNSINPWKVIDGYLECL